VLSGTNLVDYISWWWSSKGAWRAPCAAKIGWRNGGKLEGTCKQWKV